MIAAVVNHDDHYEILLPDHTIKKAEDELLKDFFLRFDNLEHNTKFQNGEGSWKEAEVNFKNVEAYIAENRELHVVNASFFRSLASSFAAENEYIDAEEFAKRNGVTVEKVKALLQAGKIPEAKKIGKRGVWIIPETSVYPVEVRAAAGSASGKPKDK